MSSSSDVPDICQITFTHKDKFFNQDKDPLLCLFMPLRMKRAQNFKGDRHLEDWKAWANNASFSSANRQWSVALIHGQEQVTALKLQMGILEFVVRWGNGETVKHSLPSLPLVISCGYRASESICYPPHISKSFHYLNFYKWRSECKVLNELSFSSDILTCCQRKVWFY